MPPGGAAQNRYVLRHIKVFEAKAGVVFIPYRLCCAAGAGLLYAVGMAGVALGKQGKGVLPKIQMVAGRRGAKHTLYICL